MVPYMRFYGFKKNQIFAQNLYVLAYGFTENSQFTAKTDQDFVLAVTLIFQISSN
jgi:hypothetical protein